MERTGERAGGEDIERAGGRDIEGRWMGHRDGRRREHQDGKRRDRGDGGRRGHRKGRGKGQDRGRPGYHSQTEMYRCVYTDLRMSCLGSCHTVGVFGGSVPGVLPYGPSGGCLKEYHDLGRSKPQAWASQMCDT